ncbi:MAG: zinc-binding dehydrogenase [Candidatus Obscuribacterales bacterium]|nr:zinc-binding dehydrogenase [Candidatus Obscuribacterales bacterium]
MKAAVLVKAGEKLQVKEMPDPKAGPQEVVIKVAACGVCHTDLHYIEYGVPTFKEPPVILGHETSGTVYELGEEVDDLEVGARVLLPAVVTCGKCRLCRIGKENICQNMVMFGNHVHGSYAEFVVAKAKDVFRLPDSLPLEEAAIIADAISTPFHAVVNRGRVRPGDTVVVFGCGGVGINAVQVAAACGAYVIAVDIADRKLAWAEQFGASKTLNISGVDKVASEIRKLTGGGGADIVFEAIGRPETIATAFDCVQAGGRLVVIGYTDQNVQFSGAKIMFKETEILGSLGCRPVDYPRILKMCVEGTIKVKPLVTHRFGLDDLDQAFELMKTGESLRSIVIPSL